MCLDMDRCSRHLTGPIRLSQWEKMRVERHKARLQLVISSWPYTGGIDHKRVLLRSQYWYAVPRL